MLTVFAAGLVSWLIKKLVETVGLRPVDRTLGGFFGLARGVVLLLAIVAAIALTMRKRPGLKVQDVSAQVAVTKEQRLRIVKMEAEKRP